jgi:hypothetical protein
MKGCRCDFKEWSLTGRSRGERQLGPDLREGRGACLLVAIDQQDIAALAGQSDGNVAGEQALPTAALRGTDSQDHVLSPDSCRPLGVRTVWMVHSALRVKIRLRLPTTARPLISFAIIL